MFLLFISLGQNGPIVESVVLQNIEAISENNAASNHSNGLMACVRINEEELENGRDAQVSVSEFIE